MTSIVTGGAWFFGSCLAVALLIEQGVIELVENKEYWHQVLVLLPDNIANAPRDWSRYLANNGAS